MDWKDQHWLDWKDRIKAMQLQLETDETISPEMKAILDALVHLIDIEISRSDEMRLHVELEHGE